MSVSWPSALHCNPCPTPCSPGNVPTPTPAPLMDITLRGDWSVHTTHYRAGPLLQLASLQTWQARKQIYNTNNHSVRPWMPAPSISLKYSHVVTNICYLWYYGMYTCTTHCTRTHTCAYTIHSTHIHTHAPPPALPTSPSWAARALQGGLQFGVWGIQKPDSTVRGAGTHAHLTAAGRVLPAWQAGPSGCMPHALPMHAHIDVLFTSLEIQLKYCICGGVGLVSRSAVCLQTPCLLQYCTTTQAHTHMAELHN